MSVPSIEYLAPSNQSLRVVIAGAGRMGGLHARALERSGRFSLVGVVDPCDPGWPTPWSRDLPALLEEVAAQAVIVAVPPASHYEVAHACLQAGCHVLLEKPICPEGSRARDLSRRFREGGRVLFGGHSERFHPVFRAFREQRTGPDEVLAVRCERVGPAPERVPLGGALLDLGIHDLDLLERLWGPVEWARAHRSGSQEVEAVGSTRWGGRIDLRCGYAPLRQRRWVVETASAIWRLDFAASRLEVEEGGRIRSLPVPSDDPLELEHAAFHRACCEADPGQDLESQLSAVEQAERIAALLG